MLVIVEIIKKTILLLLPFKHVIIPLVENYIWYISDQIQYMSPVRLYCLKLHLKLCIFSIIWELLDAFYLIIVHTFPEFCRKYMPELTVDSIIEYLEYYPIYKNYIDNFINITFTSEYETIDEFIEMLELKKEIEDLAVTMDFVLSIPVDWYELTPSQQLDLKNRHLTIAETERFLKLIQADIELRREHALSIVVIGTVFTLIYFFHLGAVNKLDPF